MKAKPLAVLIALAVITVAVIGVVSLVTNENPEDAGNGPEVAVQDGEERGEVTGGSTQDNPSTEPQGTSNRPAATQPNTPVVQSDDSLPETGPELIIPAVGTAMILVTGIAYFHSQNRLAYAKLFR